MIGRILLTLGVLAVTGFVLLALIGLWDRYEQETAALTSQAGFPIDPNARAAAEAKRGRQGALGREQLTRTKFFQQGLKLVGTGAVGSTNQGMSVALSADGNTAIAGGWSDNGSTGAAWVFTRSGGHWTQDERLVGTGAVGTSAPSVAMDFPNRHIHMVVPYPAGGMADIATRIVTDKLSEIWHQPIVVESSRIAVSAARPLFVCHSLHTFLGNCEFVS